MRQPAAETGQPASVSAVERLPLWEGRSIAGSPAAFSRRQGPREAPAAAVPAGSRRLLAEHHRRMLGVERSDRTRQHTRRSCRRSSPPPAEPASPASCPAAAGEAVR